MPNTKNAIGFPTSNGEFEEMATTAPKVNENASNILYDNSQSGLTATDVQGAIDEINNDLSEIRDTKNHGAGTQITTFPYTVTDDYISVQVQVGFTGNTIYSSGIVTLNGLEELAIVNNSGGNFSGLHIRRSFKAYKGDVINASTASDGFVNVLIYKPQ